MELHNIRSEAKGLTTWGCMWKQGECPTDTQQRARKYFICQNDKGEKVSIQSRITAYWQDGSVKWSAHTADAERLGSHITMELSDTKPDMEMQNPVKIKEDDNGFCIHTKNMILHIAKKGNNLIDTAVINNVTRLRNVHPVLQLEEPMNWNEEEAHIVKSYTGVIEQVQVEECGELMTVIRYEGCHVNREGVKKIPFIIRMAVGAELEDIHFVHTFLYDGDENRDYLKGIGIASEVAMQGELYNRHVKFMGDHGIFHEELVALRSWRPRVPQHIYEAQSAGQELKLTGTEKDIADQVLAVTPYWSAYRLCQDSASHYSIQKKIADDNCCYIDCLHGMRTQGGAAFGSENGSIT